MLQAHIFVKNESAITITLPEICGYELGAGQEVDFMDEENEGFYTDADAVLRALNELPNTVLYQKLHAGPPEISYRTVMVEDGLHG